MVLFHDSLLLRFVVLFCFVRRQRGETMPQNEQELGVMQENDPRIQPFIREM